MKNIAQIKVINNALNKEREKFLFELARINLFIENKLNTLRKFMDYMRDYTEGESFNLSRSIPSLNRNLNSFSTKIQQIILMEEKEIERLLYLKGQKLKNIAEIEQKIKVMDHFEDVAITERHVRMENHEQSSMDELNSIKHTRGDYE